MLRHRPARPIQPRNVISSPSTSEPRVARVSDSTITGAAKLRTWALVGAYGALGIVLLGSRLIGLDRSYWHDEIVTVRDFVRPGPREIVAGGLLNHELYSLLAWLTSLAVGLNEEALRLWSVAPFVVGVILVVAWLHTRIGALPAILFLFFSTCSPLLLDVTRQARGYGLAFLAMAVLVIAALEANRSGKRKWIVVFCLAGVAGSFTLPNFAIALISLASVLALDARIRKEVLLGLMASLVALFVLYAPHLGAAKEASRDEHGVWISASGLATAPIDQILLPALLRLDGAPPVSSIAWSSIAWLPIVALFLIPMLSSPLLRNTRSAAILCVGPVTTVVALWAVGTYVVPRYLSYLLVPLLMLLATGCAVILARLGSTRPGPRAFLVVALLALVGAAFVNAAIEVLGKPREAHRDAAAVIRAEFPPGAHVYGYMLQPTDLEFYLREPVTALTSPDEVNAMVCAQTQPVALVAQPWRIPILGRPCAGRIGVRRTRLEQYARGGHIDVWFIPPGS